MRAKRGVLKKHFTRQRPARPPHRARAYVQFALFNALELGMEKLPVAVVVPVAVAVQPQYAQQMMQPQQPSNIGVCHCCQLQFARGVGTGASAHSDKCPRCAGAGKQTDELCPDCIIA